MFLWLLTLSYLLSTSSSLQWNWKNNNENLVLKLIFCSIYLQLLSYSSVMYLKSVQKSQHFMSRNDATNVFMYFALQILVKSITRMHLEKRLSIYMATYNFAKCFDFSIYSVCDDPACFKHHYLYCSLGV